MKQIIRNIASLFVILVFLAGTTGVSFYIHECSSSGAKDVFIFPEITEETVSCCCEGDMNGSLSVNEKVASFNAPECCKNTHLFIKASFSGFPVYFQYSDESFIKDLPTDFLCILHDDKDHERVDFVPLVDHPPPRSGKVLIHFLHQVKIPAPVS